MLKSNSHQKPAESSRRLRRRRQRGEALLEFALTWTLFLMITVVGIMDFGRAIWSYNLLAHGAREGVRYAIVHGSRSDAPATAADIQAFVRSRTAFLDPTSVEVNVTWTPEGDNSPGSVVTVQARHTFQPLMQPILSDILLGNTASMVIAH